MPHTTHPVARVEAIEARDYYEQQTPGLGLRFLDALQVAVDRVRTYPGMYAADAQGYRIAPVDGFQHLVVYVDFPIYVWIVSITHARRRPGHWASRRPDDI